MPQNTILQILEIHDEARKRLGIKPPKKPGVVQFRFMIGPNEDRSAYPTAGDAFDAALGLMPNMAATYLRVHLSPISK